MKAPPSPDPVGESLTLTPSMLTYFCSNVSMCPGGDNEAKNTNLPRDGCVLKLAKSFIRGADNESTLFILAAARACHGTPVRYLAATKRAAKTLLSDTNRRTRKAGKKLQKRVTDLLDTYSDPTWAQSLQATTWEFEAWGTPPRYFDDERPAFITVQGQHRFTVFLLALRSSLGLGLHRAGKLSTSVLFEGEGVEKKTAQLAQVLQTTKSTCSVVVHMYLDHVQAAAVGHLTHKHEAETNHPFLLDAVAYSAPLIRQLQKPGDQHCQVRAKEFFEGKSMDEKGTCLRDLGIDWVTVFEPKAGPLGPREMVKSRKKMIKTLQGFVKQDVIGSLARIGMPEKQSSATVKFVYAAALHPDSLIVQNIVRQLQLSKDGGTPRQDIDCEVLAMLFGLSKASQRKEAVWNELERVGFSNPAREVLLGLGRIELFENIVTSLALGLPRHVTCDHRFLDLDDEGVAMQTKTLGDQAEGMGHKDLEWRGPAKLEGFFSIILKLCSDANADAYFSDTTNNNLRNLVLDAERLLPKLSAFVGASFRPEEITKKILAPARGRMQKSVPTASNTSRMTPGGNAKTGNPLPLFISISGTPVPFDQRVLTEYLAEGKGHTSRVMFLCFAVLIIDRALWKRGLEGDHVPQRFEDLLRAMPESAVPLKEGLLTRAHELAVSDEEKPDCKDPFFDPKRLAYLRRFQAPKGPREEKDEGVHQVTVSGAGAPGVPAVHISLPTSVMQGLGIMTESGTTVDHSVGVVVTPSIDQDGCNWVSRTTDHPPALAPGGVISEVLRNKTGRDKKRRATVKGQDGEGNLHKKTKKNMVATGDAGRAHGLDSGELGMRQVRGSSTETQNDRCVCPCTCGAEGQ